ncbi:hypothetical protein [Nisaea sp.]|uniref:hypothetical protein n=1 Tax=Nisaea sp. TaxID=2024842 RepID=UPI0032645F99
MKTSLRLVWVAVLIGATQANAETTSPFGASSQPVSIPVTPTQVAVPQTIVLPPLSFFAVIGRTALLADGGKVIRAQNGQRVTITGRTYKARIVGETLTLYLNDEPAFFASLGYGVRTHQNTSQD